MVAVVSTGAGLLWLGAALFLMLLVTVVILTGDNIDELEESSEPEPSAGEQAVGADPRITAYH